MESVLFFNSEKNQTVTLQPMIHVNNHTFYKKVKSKINELLVLTNKNCEILFEEVKKEDEEDILVNKFLSNITLIDNIDLKECYGLVAKYLGLELQDNSILIQDDETSAKNQGYVPLSNAFNVDVKHKDMNKLLQESNLYDKSLKYHQYFEAQNKLLTLLIEQINDSKKENLYLLKDMNLLKEYIFNKTILKSLCKKQELKTFEDFKNYLEKSILMKLLFKIALKLKLGDKISNKILSNGVNKEDKKSLLDKLLDEKTEVQQNSVHLEEAEKLVNKILSLNLEKFNELKTSNKEEFNEKLKEYFQDFKKLKTYKKDYEVLKKVLLNEFFKIILYKRNKFLIEDLNYRLNVRENKTNANLFVLYGALHFNDKIEEEYNIIKFLEKNGFKQI